MRLVERKPVLPPEAQIPCPAPASLPDRALSAREVTRSWGTDRANLQICEERRAAAVAAVEGPR